MFDLKRELTDEEKGMIAKMAIMFVQNGRPFVQSMMISHMMVAAEALDDKYGVTRIQTTDREAFLREVATKAPNVFDAASSIGQYEFITRNGMSPQSKVFMHTDGDTYVAAFANPPAEILGGRVPYEGWTREQVYEHKDEVEAASKPDSPANAFLNELSLRAYKAAVVSSPV